MNKLIKHNYANLLAEVNELIVKETKAAVRLLPEKKIEGIGRIPLCRVLVSSEDYCPRDLRVKRVWINEYDELAFSEYTAEEDEDDTYTWTENDDLLNITDFSYLIHQIAEKLEIAEVLETDDINSDENTTYTLFGSDAVRAYNDSLTDDEDVDRRELLRDVLSCDNSLHSHTFRTKEEVAAYYAGVDDYDGWLDATSITREDYETLQELMEEDE